MRPVVVLMMTLLAAMAVPGAARGQESHCADCHISNPAAAAVTGFEESHIVDWDHSAHGRNRVGCDRCHGGDPTTFEPFRAHAGILNSRNPASPANRANLPRTCGVCHAGPFVAFQRSRHDELLRGGDEQVPSCSTCHGEMGAHLLAPKGLESQCARCHGAGKVDPNPEYAKQARLMLEGIRDVRAMLNEARPLVGRIKDKARREALTQEYEQAEVPLTEAVHAGHAFVFDQLEERLAVARKRAEALLERLANP